MLYCIILYSDSNCSCNCNCIVLYYIKRSRHQRLHTGFAATFSCKKGRFPHGFPVLPTQDSANRAGFYTYFKGKITNHWFILLHFFFGRQKCPGQATNKDNVQDAVSSVFSLCGVSVTFACDDVGFVGPFELLQVYTCHEYLGIPNVSWFHAERARMGSLEILHTPENWHETPQIPIVADLLDRGVTPFY